MNNLAQAYQLRLELLDKDAAFNLESGGGPSVQDVVNARSILTKPVFECQRVPSRYGSLAIVMPGAGSAIDELERRPDLDYLLKSSRAPGIGKKRITQRYERGY